MRFSRCEKRIAKLMSANRSRHNPIVIIRWGDAFRPIIVDRQHMA
jgi:hypothetical protein